MAHLSDLINVENNLRYITVQKAKLPIHFGMDAMEFIADIYEDDYSVFEKDLSTEFKDKNKVEATRKNMKIIRALIYGMVRSGGTECTPEELHRSIPFSQLPDVYETCLNVFMEQNFSVDDLKK